MSQSTTPVVLTPSVPRNPASTRRIYTTSETPSAARPKKTPTAPPRGKTVPVEAGTRIPAAYDNKHPLFTRAWWTEVSKGDRLWTDISKISATTLKQRLKAVVPKITISVIADAEERKQRNKEKKAERVTAQDEAGEVEEDAEGVTAEDAEAGEGEEEIVEDDPEGKEEEENMKTSIKMPTPTPDTPASQAASEAKPIKTEPTALPTSSTPTIVPKLILTAPKRKHTTAIKPEAKEAKAEKLAVKEEVEAEAAEPPKKMIKIDEGELAVLGGMAKRMNERDAKLRKEAIKVENE